MRDCELLLRIFRRSPQLEEFAACLPESDCLSVAGLAGSGAALLIAETFTLRRSTILVVVPTEGLALRLVSDLRELAEPDSVGYYADWGINPYAWLVAAPENVAQRLETVYRLASGQASIIVTTPEALVTPTIAPADLERAALTLRRGEEYDLEDLAARLTLAGYDRQPVTEEIGSFSVRGGILDVFPFTSENPVRAEFFGDELESMRQFSVLTQRSVGPLASATIVPRREVLIEQKQLEMQIDSLSEADSRFLRERCLGGFGYPGLEWVSSCFATARSYLFAYLPDDCLVYLSDPQLIRSRLDSFAIDTSERFRAIKPSLKAVPAPAEVFLDPEAATANLQEYPRIEESILGGRNGAIDFGMKDHPSYGGQISLLRKSLPEYSAAGREVFIACESKVQMERMRDLLAESAEQLHFLVARLSSGFEFPAINLILLTDRQIFDRRELRHRRRKFKEGTAITSYQALNVGDYVVHVDYGIGRYRGLREIKVGDQRRECLEIRYAEDAKLYVPIEEFGRVQKYVGKDGKPALTRLGGKSWEKAKARTKKAIADMAEELLRLYAARKTRPGYSYGEDDEMMRQLEASFPYEETVDQLDAIAAVKKDMRAPTPTDRLVCGDVGFGKTEVAIRAALKAVAEGKQVAVLVPTTILAQQHVSTFAERLASFPIKVEMLSRFRTRLQQKEIIAELAHGKVDIVIGTHRLFSKDIVIPDIGMLIIDEEHRFGVAHKEKLKRIKETVDCLSLSATPIPRTLHMSLLGVRDISLINTPPKLRQSIVTEIAEFDPRIIYAAITEEIARQGQVYFVHNRVQSIYAMHEYLSKLLAPIRIAVAHGQMPEKELEEVMLAFLRREYDVLLSTSIIESGIDIPSVNTIIINRADRFGLAQLYQLRGRVGRAEERAYAYLLVPPVRLLTDTARKRLKAIEQHTELGSGFKLAMKDLEIRGAGNLLGPQQHGFIEEVGFDLYCKLLEETVAELKGEAPSRLPEVKLEYDGDFYLPDDYVEHPQQRVEIYRKLSEAAGQADLQSLRAELIDRFGRFNDSVENLLDLIAVRIAAGERRISSVKIYNGRATVSYDDGALPTKEKVERFRAAAPEKVAFDASRGFTIKIEFPVETVRPLAELKKLLQLL